MLGRKWTQLASRAQPYVLFLHIVQEAVNTREIGFQRVTSLLSVMYRVAVKNVNSNVADITRNELPRHSQAELKT